MRRSRARSPGPPAPILIALLCVADGCDQKPPRVVNPEGPVKNAEANTVARADAIGAEPGIAPGEVLSTGSQTIKPELAEMAALMIRGETGKARVRLRNHMLQHPEDGQAAFLFGMTYHREKKYGEARPYFEQALQLAPDYVLTNYYYGWTLYYLGELPGSRAAFERFVASQPDEYDSHYALGLIALDEDRLEDAEASLTRSLALLEAEGERGEEGGGAADPKSLSKVLTRLGEIDLRRNRLPEARARLERAVTLYPDHYESLYKLYRVLVRMAEMDAAEQTHAQYLTTRERVRPGTSFPE